MKGAAVPLLEGIGKLVVVKAEPALHQVVGLGDELHHGILDPVVDHLYEMPRGPRTQVGHTGFPADVGGDRLEDVLDPNVGLPGAAGHDAGAAAGALLAARDPHTQEMDPLPGQHLLPQGGVGEMRIAAVDEDVRRPAQGQQFAERRVHGRPCRHEDHDDTGGFQQGHALLRGSRPADRVSRRAPAIEVPDAGGDPVVPHRRVAVISHVQQQVQPHHSQSDHADIVFLWLHGHLLPGEADLMRVPVGCRRRGATPGRVPSPQAHLLSIPPFCARYFPLREGRMRTLRGAARPWRPGPGGDDRRER